MDIVINGLFIPGGIHWLLDTTSGNVAILISAYVALYGAWALK